MYKPIIRVAHKKQTTKAESTAIAPSLVSRNNKPSVMPKRMPVSTQYFSSNTFHNHLEDFTIKEKVDNMPFLTSSSLMPGLINFFDIFCGICLVPQ